ncbi:MAG: ABC transporter substrate-binding protein [bacterium]
MRRTCIGLLILSLLIAALALNSASVFAAKKQLSVLYGGAPLPKEETFRKLIVEYEKARPDVKAEIVTVAGNFWAQVKVLAAANNLTDVMRLDDDWSGEHMVYGNVIDLTDRIKKEVNVRDFFLQSWLPFVYKGRMFGVPYDAAVDVIFYNTKLFAAAGLPSPPRDPAKWTNQLFLEYAQKLTKDTDGDGKADQWGFTYPAATTGYYQAQHWLWREGGSLYDKEKTVCTLPDQENAVKALQFYTDLRNKYNVAPPIDVARQMGGSTLFYSGKVGMLLDANWGITDAEKARKSGVIEYGVVYMPSGSKGNVTRITCDAWGITKNAKDVELAWDFVRWMGSAEGQKLLGGYGTFTPPNMKVSLSPEYMDNKDTYYDESIFVEIVQKYSRMGEICLQGSEVADAWTRATEPLWLGKATALEAAKSLKKLLDPLLAKEAQYRPFAPWYIEDYNELIK